MQRYQNALGCLTCSSSAVRKVRTLAQGARLKLNTWLLLVLLSTSLPFVVPLTQGQPVLDKDSQTTLLPGLRVQGNQLVNDAGKTVVLHGVNRSGPEYMCIDDRGIFDGPADAASVRAIASWHINAVRVPLNEDCWLDINGAPAAYSGKHYQQAIAQFVHLLNQYGLYAILDLHWNAPGSAKATGLQPMPDRDHAIAFWTQVGTTFKQNTAVLFDLFNEPYPDNNQDTTAGWRCLRDGGTCPGVPFQAAGMQELVHAIRSTGSSNVIMVGGLQYANALSQWLTYEPTDPLHNLAASWHVYPSKNACNTTSCYDSKAAPVAKHVPLIAGEIGDDCRTLPAFNSLMSWLDNHNAGYLAWTWDTWGPGCSTYSLISKYNGIPTSPYGQDYKDHLSQLAG